MHIDCCLLNRQFFWTDNCNFLNKIPSLLVFAKVAVPLPFGTIYSFLTQRVLKEDRKKMRHSNSFSIKNTQTVPLNIGSISQVTGTPHLCIKKRWMKGNMNNNFHEHYKRMGQINISNNKYKLNCNIDFFIFSNCDSNVHFVPYY